ncbi:hypothetical protein E4U43_007459 [Claviceps pusilla]|uniref:Uncharacterized protein n=1 Tax=Claviceps pusilla TaxID=123648 RepID=A0A9P7NEV4_9HYPO|nr:hypothetical protein E4U43_007459 [Claviceps pusilla]
MRSVFWSSQPPWDIGHRLRLSVSVNEGIHRNDDNGHSNALLLDCARTVLHAARRIHEGMACISAQATQGRTRPHKASTGCQRRNIEVERSRCPDVRPLSPKFGGA